MSIEYSKSFPRFFPEIIFSLLWSLLLFLLWWLLLSLLSASAALNLFVVAVEFVNFDSVSFSLSEFFAGGQFVLKNFIHQIIENRWWQIEKKRGSFEFRLSIYRIMPTCPYRPNQSTPRLISATHWAHFGNTSPIAKIRLCKKTKILISTSWGLLKPANIKKKVPSFQYSHVYFPFTPLPARLPACLLTPYRAFELCHNGMIWII